MVLSFSKKVLLKQDNNCLKFEQIKEINHTKLTTLKDTEEYLEGSTDCRLCVWGWCQVSLFVVCQRG